MRRVVTRAPHLRLLRTHAPPGDDELEALAREVRETPPDERAEAIARAIAEELIDFRVATSAPPSRVEIALHVGLLADGEHWVGFSETLDHRSIFITTYLTKPVGTDVELLIELPDGHIADVHGVVAGVRAEPRGPIGLPGMEVRIVSSSADDAERLARVIDLASPELFPGPRPTVVDA